MDNNSVSIGSGILKIKKMIIQKSVNRLLTMEAS